MFWKKPKLKDGEKLCPKCKGKGRTRVFYFHDHCDSLMCNKCYGKGKLDWVEQIVGVKPPTPRQHFTGTSCVSFSVVNSSVVDSSTPIKASVGSPGPGMP